MVHKRSHEDTCGKQGHLVTEGQMTVPETPCPQNVRCFTQTPSNRKCRFYYFPALCGYVTPNLPPFIILSVPLYLYFLLSNESLFFY